jgi:hypothetical protein
VGRFHALILFGLGITWILDGIEVTIVSPDSSEIFSEKSRFLGKAAKCGGLSDFSASAHHSVQRSPLQ